MISKIHISKIQKELSNSYVVKKKRERRVLYNNGIFYKVWDQNWVSSQITEHCFDIGFYNGDNAESVCALLFDETGPRGYMQKGGLSLGSKPWSNVSKQVSKEKLANFLSQNMQLSLELDGLYADFAPSNVILFEDKLNFIDLESYRSFSFVFDGKPLHYENFDLNAWWKPLETAKRDVNAFYKACFKDFLGLALDFEINSRTNFRLAKEILDSNF